MFKRALTLEEFHRLHFMQDEPKGELLVPTVPMSEERRELILCMGRELRAMRREMREQGYPLWGFIGRHMRE